MNLTLDYEEVPFDEEPVAQVRLFKPSASIVGQKAPAKRTASQVPLCCTVPQEVTVGNSLVSNTSVRQKNVRTKTRNKTLDVKERDEFSTHWAYSPYPCPPPVYNSSPHGILPLPPMFPTQSLVNDATTCRMPHIESVGPPQLKIYKCRLPSALIPLLQRLIAHSEAFCRTQPHGWRTHLYTLTKQDVALSAVPGGLDLAAPVTACILEHIRVLYHVPAIRMDRNQPHVLKYVSGGDAACRGVGLHYDRCDVTANLLLAHAFRGGGTFFPAALTTVHLQPGEFLLHPGSLIHQGLDVTAGTRYLMVMFCHVGKAPPQSNRKPKAVQT
jgi:hypothetical protein